MNRSSRKMANTGLFFKVLEYNRFMFSGAGMRKKGSVL
ncbi:hypothetical protein LEP1GSC081_4126 [Leptospira kirschneri str. H1]|uniref:Uncharacterized protein n=1 Tax=Leptospira kirschneri str. H1 TaxID=1049966 RepID=A0A0E2B5G8_9LEPT|nr:hypothetical protein LEP1GSC081_4126 [Leptospira kirschneri str. H1]